METMSLNCMSAWFCLVWEMGLEMGLVMPGTIIVTHSKRMYKGLQQQGNIGSASQIPSSPHNIPPDSSTEKKS